MTMPDRTDSIMRCVFNVVNTLIEYDLFDHQDDIFDLVRYTTARARQLDRELDLDELGWTPQCQEKA